MLLHTRIGYGLIAVLLLVLTACGGGTAPQSEPADTNPIEVQNAWVRPAVMTGMADETPDTMEGMEGSETADTDEMTGTMEGMEGMEGMDDMSGHASASNSAAYMIIMNNSDTDNAIVGAATDVATTVELHTVEMDNGVMKMRPVEQIDVPANGQATLQPGGFHVMLLGIKQDLVEGDTVDLTLTFQNGEEITVAAPVGEPATTE